MPKVDGKPPSRFSALSPVAEEAVWKERVGKLNLSLSRQSPSCFNMNPYVNPHSKHDKCAPVVASIGRRRPNTTATNPSSTRPVPSPQKLVPPVLSKHDRIIRETVSKSDDSGLLWRHTKTPVFASDMERIRHSEAGPTRRGDEDATVDFCSTFRILKTVAKSASAANDEGVLGRGAAHRRGLFGSDGGGQEVDVLAKEVHLVNAILNKGSTSSSSQQLPSPLSSSSTAVNTPSQTHQRPQHCAQSRVTKSDLRWARNQLAAASGSGGGGLSLHGSQDLPTVGTDSAAHQLRTHMSPLGFEGSADKKAVPGGGYRPGDMERLGKAREAILNARSRAPQDRFGMPVTSSMSVGWVEGAVVASTKTMTANRTATVQSSSGSSTSAFTVADKRSLRNVLRGYDEEEAVEEQRRWASQQRASSAMMFDNANLDKMGTRDAATPPPPRAATSLGGATTRAASLQRNDPQAFCVRGPSPIPTTGHTTAQANAAAAKAKLRREQAHAFSLSSSRGMATASPLPTMALQQAASSNDLNRASNGHDLDSPASTLWSLTPQPTPNAFRNQSLLHFGHDKKLSEITNFSCRTGVFDCLTKSSKLKS